MVQVRRDPITVPAAAIDRTSVAAADDTQEGFQANLDGTVGDETAVPDGVEFVYCYGPNAVGTARDDAWLSWMPVAGATAYRIFCDGSPLENIVQAPGDCYMVAQPLGHTYRVAAMFNDYEGGESQPADLVSENPYFDSSGVSCTATSCEDDAVVWLGFTESCYWYDPNDFCVRTVSYIRLDPEVNSTDNVYCEYNLVGGRVYVGLSDGSCMAESALDGEMSCDDWGSGSFYYSAGAYSDKPTYLVMVLEGSCTYPTCDAATLAHEQAHVKQEMAVAKDAINIWASVYAKTGLTRTQAEGYAAILSNDDSRTSAQGLIGGALKSKYPLKAGWRILEYGDAEAVAAERKFLADHPPRVVPSGSG